MGHLQGTDRHLSLARKQNKVDATCLSTVLMLLVFVKVLTPVGMGLIGN